MPEPRQRNPVADLVRDDAVAELLDDPDALMTGDERCRRFDRPVAAGGVDVGVADAGRLDPDQDLAGARCGDGKIADLERGPEGRTTAARMGGLLRTRGAGVWRARGRALRVG